MTLTLIKRSKGSSGHPFMAFTFMHNGIGHTAELRGEWGSCCTGTSAFMTEGPEGNGRWIVASGNNQDSCTGEGRGIRWTADILSES